MHVDGAAEDLLLHQVVLVDVLGVTLQDVNRAQVTSVGDDGRLGSDERGCHGLRSGARGTSHCWASLNRRQAVDVVISVAIDSALTALLVQEIVVVEPMALTLGAVEAEHLLEEEGHDSVRLLHLDFIVALGTRQVL